MVDLDVYRFFRGCVVKVDAQINCDIKYCANGGF